MTEKRNTSNRGAKKQETKVEPKVYQEPVSYIHIDEFIELAKLIYPNEMDSIRCAGFRALVAPKVHFKDELELKRQLEKYLGK